jgi:pimeloyl-ACP methyl ester carboxylesterase
VSRVKKQTLVILLVLSLLFSIFVIINKKSDQTWNISKYNSQIIKWESCYESFECGSFKVPINYEAMASGSFTLQLIRRSATDKSGRLGSIIVNPGGPGGSGYDYAMSAETSVSASLLAKFDIVGFDGRGIGSSEPLRCLSDSEEDRFIDIDGAGNSSAELISAAKKFAQACAKAAGGKIGHLSTFESAKDMEILRHLLHEPKLNYLGKSYGTYLGSIYISLFPSSVGKFVLDGAVDPNISIRDQSLNQAAGFEKALGSYLMKNSSVTKSDIQNLIEASGANPLKSQSGRILSRSLLITALAASLYDNVLGWRELTIALTDAITKANPDRLLKIADSYNNRDVNGHFYNNQNDIGIAINCLDWNSRSSYSELAKDVPNFVKASATFGRYIAFSQLPCRYWEAPPLSAKLPFHDINSPPFLIIGVTRDPATPYIWAENLASEFPAAVLLSLQGEGHTGHNRGNKCIDAKVDAFFLRGTLPPKGVLCVTGGN